MGEMPTKKSVPFPLVLDPFCQRIQDLSSKLFRMGVCAPRAGWSGHCAPDLSGPSCHHSLLSTQVAPTPCPVPQAPLAGLHTRPALSKTTRGTCRILPCRKHTPVCVASQAGVSGSGLGPFPVMLRGPGSLSLIVLASQPGSVQTQPQK